MQVFIIATISYFIGRMTSHQARLRGRAPKPWFWIGFFFGILGLLALFLIPRKRTLPTRQRRKSSPPLPLQFQATHPNYSGQLWYYLDSDNTQIGPMSLEALTRARIEGIINDSTYVWHELLDEWQRFTQAFRSV